MKCPVTNVHIPRFLLTTGGIFATTYLFDLLWHGVVKTGNHILFIHVLLAAVITLLFTRHYEKKGLKEGIRFGFLVGLVLGVYHITIHTGLLADITTLIHWLGSHFVKYIGVGIVAVLLYDDKCKVCDKK